MFSINVPKLRGKMAEKGYNISTLANVIGVNRNTLTQYLRDTRKIPYGTICVMSDILCDDTSEAVNIFFGSDLRNTKDLHTITTVSE
jgi:predicted transcriptional regulator